MSRLSRKYKPKSRVRSTRTRKALLDALLSLLEEKTFDRISVVELTNRANVGYATFFRRYPDKESLLHDLAADEIQNLLSLTLPMLDFNNFHSSNITLCEYIDEHRALWKALLTGGAASILKEEYLLRAQKLAEEKSDPPALIPPDLAITFAVTTTLEIITWWLKHPDPPSANQVAMYLDQLSMEPMFNVPKEKTLK